MRLKNHIIPGVLGDFGQSYGPDQGLENPMNDINDPFEGLHGDRE